MKRELELVTIRFGFVQCNRNDSAPEQHLWGLIMMRLTFQLNRFKWESRVLSKWNLSKCSIGFILIFATELVGPTYTLLGFVFWTLLRVSNYFSDVSRIESHFKFANCSKSRSIKGPCRFFARQMSVERKPLTGGPREKTSKSTESSVRIKQQEKL